MNHAGYEIIPYRHDFMLGVVKVLVHLWGDNYERNLSYFKWKHYDNPYAESPLGIVALYKSKIVGFRGYFATGWKIRDRAHNFVMLCPGDTCVDPEHRLKGLSVAMGNLAMEEYASKYRLFFNTSASESSVPGYLKMGYLPLAPKAYLTLPRYLYERLFPDNLLLQIENSLLAKSFGLIERYNLRLLRKIRLCKRRILPGEQGNIAVSERPRPKDMQAVASAQPCDAPRISLLQDESFFKWRYKNPKNRYVFYFYNNNNNTPTGYIVIRVIEKSWIRIGHIVDFAESEDNAFNNILRYIVKNNHFDIIHILSTNLRYDFLQVLKRMKFKTNNTIHRQQWGEWPLFVRPVKKNYNDNDWYIDGLDIREIKNWEIKEICSDGA